MKTVGGLFVFQQISKGKRNGPALKCYQNAHIFSSREQTIEINFRSYNM